MKVTGSEAQVPLIMTHFCINLTVSLVVKMATVRVCEDWSGKLPTEGRVLDTRGYCIRCLITSSSVGVLNQALWETEAVRLGNLRRGQEPRPTWEGFHFCTDCACLLLHKGVSSSDFPSFN